MEWRLARLSASSGSTEEVVHLTYGDRTLSDGRGHTLHRAGMWLLAAAAGRRGISLDTFTCAELGKLLDLLDKERAAFGGAYPDQGLLMVNEEARPLHPDSITAWFNRLVDRAGVPHIRLHDVRQPYATPAMDLGIDPRCSATGVAREHLRHAGRPSQRSRSEDLPRGVCHGSGHSVRLCEEDDSAYGALEPASGSAHRPARTRSWTGISHGALCPSPCCRAPGSLTVPLARLKGVGK